MDELLDVKRLSDWLKVKPSWIYEKTRTGEIPFLKVGKYLRFDKSAVWDWLKKRNEES